MKILIYTDIPLTDNYKAGNINALMTLVNHLSMKASVDVLCTHFSRPNRQFPPNVNIHWYPDFVNLVARKCRKLIGAERGMLNYKDSFFKRAVLNRRLRLDDYHLVIVEYVENVVLLDTIRSTTRAPVICDIHDLMSQRAKAFTQASQAHKENLNISVADEIGALARFDGIIALQAVEAASIRNALPDMHVMVTRRPPPVPPVKAPQTKLEANHGTLNAEVTLGFLGTSASFNVDAATRLLSREFMIESGVRYIIGGSVCGHVSAQSGNVEMMGVVDSLVSFYGRIDALANLIGYGSGLKTKNLEALAHGVPVITTSVGAEGMEDLIGHGLYLADTAYEFRQAVHSLSNDLKLGGLSEKISASYQNFFAADRVFAELDKYINSLAIAN